MFDIRAFSRKLFEDFPCRFNSGEKDRFISGINELLKDMGYSQEDIQVMRHKGMMTSRNIVIGDPLKATRYITAHYDTPGRNGFLLKSSSILGQTGANILFIILLLPLMYLLMLLERWLMGIFASGAHEYPVALSIFMAFVPLILYIVFFIAIMVIKNPSSRNDNTSGTLAALACADRLSDKVKAGKVCVVLFDNEEWGLVGSACFAKYLKKNKIDLKQRTVINLDCVGVGDKLVAATTSKPRKGISDFLERLELPSLGPEPEEGRSFDPRDRFGRVLRKRSNMVYMSDHANFPDSAMLCTMLNSKLGFLYLPNIHTAKDTECDVDMIDILSERITDAVNGLLGQEDGATRF